MPRSALPTRGMTQRTPSRRPRKALAASGAAALALLLDGPPAGALTGGTPVMQGEYPFVARVMVEDTAGCSGALLAPQWVVTAKACLTPAEVSSSGSLARSTTVTIGRADLNSSTGHVIAVTEAVLHADRDMALLHLATKVTDITPLKLTSGPPAVGQELRGFGYGRTAQDQAPDRLQAALFQVQAVKGPEVTVVGALDEAATTCTGDAGGPLVRITGSAPELVAIHTTSWQHGCFGMTETRQGTVGTRVDDLATWIAKVVGDQPTPTSTRQLAKVPSGDFDGDGRADLVGYSTSGDELWWIPNTTAGAGKPSRGSSLRVTTGWRTISDQFFTDYNGDGKADVVGRAGNQLWVWVSTSSVGAPANSGGYVLNTAWNTIGTMAATDLDGDGLIDIVGFDTTRDGLWWIRNTTPSGGTPSAGPLQRLGVGWAGVSSQTFGDYDGDGRVDVLGRVSDQEIRVWLNTGGPGAPVFEPPGTSLGSTWANLSGTLALVDFDGDRRLDVLAYDSTRDSLRWIPNTTPAGGAPTHGNMVLISNGWATVKDQRLMDYDGDGRIDIVGRVGDELRVWLNTSAPGEARINQSGFTLGTNWNSIGTLLAVTRL